MGNEEILERTEAGMQASNKTLIRELIFNLEEKGILPVISVDGEVKKLKLIHMNELADFVKIPFQKYGCERSDFCVLEDEKTDCENSKMALSKSLVMVVHKKTSKVQKYKAGNASHWVVDFLHDLEKKFFVNS